MDKNDRIFFYKEDVWTQGPHRMTSASRDIFEHFYKSIKSTFKDQFKDPKIQELIEKIYYVRQLEIERFKLYGSAASSKQDQVSPILYKEQRTTLPEEKEWDNDELVPKELMTYDLNIYPDFETFFEKADHGFVKTEDAKQHVYELWNIFIKKFSINDLENQLKHELISLFEWELRLKKTLNEFIKSDTNLTWHQFLHNFMSYD